MQGTLELYQGKWVLQEGRDEEEEPDGTNLKFAVEVGDRSSLAPTHRQRL